MAKLTTLLILISFMQISAEVNAQAGKLDLKVKNVSILEVFEEIEDNSEYRFFYDNDQVDLSKEVSMDTKQEELAKVLKELFKGTDLTYQVKDRLILVQSKTSNVNINIAQQQPTISGTVTDEAGEPLPGVTVVVKGTTQGTVTNAAGEYTLRDIPEDATLQFSFVGMRTQEVVVGNQTNIDVTMTVDAIGIEEVVAVGYGTQKKVNLTGAIGISKGEVLENRPISNALEGLQGVIAGLNISNSDGQPGSNPKINIRGATSISGGQPLVLVDGTEMNLNLVNPDDIESISVLKDAASAAIYGARAAYGVVLVTTKSGKKNRDIRVSYSGNYFVSRPTIVPKKVDSYRYALYINEMRRSTNHSIPFTEEHLSLIKGAVDGTGKEGWTLRPTNNGSYYQHFNTDWIDLVLSDASPGSRHNISLTGGGEKNSYYISAGYTGYDGIVKIGGDRFNRYNVNTKVENDIANWLNTYFQVNFARSTTNVHNLPPGHGNSIFHTLYRARPTMAPTIEKDGVEYPIFIRLNAVETLKRGGRDIESSNNINAKGGLEITFNKFKLFSNFTYNPFIRERVLNNVEFPAALPWAPGNPIRIDGGPSYIDKRNSTNYYYAFDAYGTYENTYNEIHDIKMMGGYNQEWRTISNVRAYNSNLISFENPSLSNSTGDPIVADNFNQWALRSAFFRFNYSLNNKYLLEINGRYDGSSRFKKEDRFGFFPSLSAGWRISEEPFLQNVAFLDNLKLRSSYGSLGNQSTSVLYPVSQYNTVSQVGFLFDGSRPVGIEPGNPLGEKRTWETVTTYDVGLDITLFQNLELILDGYKRITKNMLVTGNALPGVYGAPAPQINDADLEVNGWELTINWNDKIGNDFNYNLGIALSDWVGTITKFDNPTKSLEKAYYEGMTIGEIWGYETAGLFQNQSEIDAAADHSLLGGGNLIAPGDVHYADLNNDGVISTGENTVDNPGDRRIIGNTTPRYSYSIRGGAEWKNFDINLFFQGIGKRDFWLTGPLFFGGQGWGNAIVTEYLYNNEWSDGKNGLPENLEDAYYFRPSQFAVYNRNRQVQTRYLQNAAYLRLKNISLGYTLSKAALQKIGISNCRIFISGENLLTFTNLNPNFDPEVLVPGEAGQGATQTVYNSTISGKAYPLSKRLSLGANIVF